MRSRPALVTLSLGFALLGCERSETTPEVRPAATGPAVQATRPSTVPSASEQPTASARLHFIYAMIPQAINPIERGAKYEDPLQAYLVANGLGEVTGGGTMQDKDGKTLFVGIDIEVHDIEKAVPLIAEKLAALGAPPGSQLEYEFNGAPTTRPIGRPTR